jgi:hypothetical protein
MLDAVALRAERRVLSAVEFDVVWEGLGLGPTPVVLHLASPGRTHTERRRIEADAGAALRARGLAHPAGLEPGLEHHLRLLAAPALRLELRTWSDGIQRAVVAGTGEEGVLARRHDDAVVVESCSSLAAAVVGMLPSCPAGHGRAANVPTAALVAALGQPSGAGVRADLVTRGAAPDEAGQAARMLSGVRRRAQVAAVAADQWGVPRRYGDVLGVLDGARGRYLMTRTRGDGTDWTTVAPTDDRRLRHRIADLLTDAADAAAAEP